MEGRQQALPRNGFFTKVAGTTFADEGAIDASLMRVGVLLLRDHHTPDPFAIQILRTDDGRRIGYVPAIYACHLAQYADDQGLSATILEVTGGVEGKENLGVNVYISDDYGRPLPSKEFMLGEGRRAS